MGAGAFLRVDYVERTMTFRSHFIDLQITFYRMDRVRGIHTRYFLFTMVDPLESDVRFMVNTCQGIDACFGYRVYHVGERNFLKGFIILRKSRTSDRSLGMLFPRFLLTPVREDFDLDFGVVPSDVTVVGVHPYRELRRRLFDDTLSGFFSSA